MVNEFVCPFFFLLFTFLVFFGGVFVWLWLFLASVVLGHQV